MAALRPLVTPLVALALAALPACTSGDAAGPGGAGGDAGPSGGDAAAGDPRFEALAGSLESGGNVVQRAATAPFLLEDCGALPSCFASNATSPYGLWNLPPPPGGALPEGALLPPRTPEGTSPAWQLRDDEVIVYVGRTPPPAAYFSYAPYLYSRPDPATGERVPIFASLSDARNLVNLRTAPGGPFDRETVILLTAHAGAEAATREALVAAGYPDEIVNTIPIDADLLRLGTADDADLVMMLQRFALFEDAAAGAAYLADLPARLLRVSPLVPLERDPIAVPPRVARGTGSTEDALAPALDALEAAIRARHGAPSDAPLTVASAALVTSVFDPVKCIADLTECKGEVSDTTYAAAPVEVTTFGGSLQLTKDPGDFFLTFGVNHEASGKATYSNVVVNNWNKQAGIAALDSRRMVGSARAYLPDHPDADSLFVVKVARDCGDEPHCLAIPETFPGIALDQNIVFLFRAYLEPGTAVSPGPTELLPERVLHYLPAAR